MKNSALVFMSSLLTAQMALAQFTSFKPFDYEREDYVCDILPLSPDKNLKQNSPPFTFGKDLKQVEVTSAVKVKESHARFVITRQKETKSIEVYATDGGKKSVRQRIGNVQRFEDGNMIELSVPELGQRLFCMTESTAKLGQYMDFYAKKDLQFKIEPRVGTTLNTRRMEPTLHGEYLLPGPAAKLKRNSSAQGQN